MYQTETTRPIHDLALSNSEPHRVVIAGGQLQVVLMAVPEGGEIRDEARSPHDQVLVFVDGEGFAVIGDTETHARPGDMSFLPAGRFHNIRNTGQGLLRLYAIKAAAG